MFGKLQILALIVGTQTRAIGLRRRIGESLEHQPSHDLAMLQIARRAFPVNPSPALLQAAAKNGWGYFRPQGAEGVLAAVGGE